ncbi:exonuclease domain-containing protein [Kitasatospora sp. NPDC057541]|uniref:exonuclease domain-containing protein n=1 Tax=unclassified Kitasatospora TaxID=2633591 RepID=UPI0036B26452
MPRDLGDVLHESADGRHTYRSNRAPAHLLTRAQLRAQGLSEAGLQPAGWLHYNEHHGTCPLFDPATARPVRSLTERQRENLARGRLLANTAPCVECEVARVRWYPSWEGVPVCDGCGPARWERREREAAERRQAARREHAEMLVEAKRSASRWAAGLLELVDGPVGLPLEGAAGLLPVVVDAETTGLSGYVVDLTVMRLDGEVLLDTLVDPQMPIPEEATEVHGITDEMVRGAPVFGDVVARLEEVLRGRRVLIWNAPFDVGVVGREMSRLVDVDGPQRRPEGAGPEWSPDWEAFWARERQVEKWMASYLPQDRVSCVMRQHARCFGAWDEYRGDFRWQKLGGPHRALGDCRQVVVRLREMAADGGPSEGEV